MSRLFRISWIALGLLAASAAVSRADLTFTVTLDTTPLESAPDASQGPFYIDLTLTSNAQSSNTRVTISNFSFGAGGSAGSGSYYPLSGGAGGDLGSGVTLVDSTMSNDYNQAFNPGSQLQFLVSVATSSYNTPIPDNFSFSILNGSGDPIATTDPSGVGTLLNFDVTGPMPTINLYSSPADNLSAPSVSYPTSVPEPATFLMVGLGLTLARTVVRRR